MKKAVIISLNFSYSYNVRIKFLEDYLINAGYKVTILTANFEHRNKKRFNIDKENVVLISVPTYKKNLSIGRIVSHMVFSKKCWNHINKINPDLVYASTPPNSIINDSKRWKHKNDLFIEIGDLWPETFPVSNTKRFLLGYAFKKWKNLRNRELLNSNGVIFECKLFKNKIESQLGESGLYNVLYYCKDDENLVVSDIDSLEEICLGYLGSINNIINIKLILSFVKKLSKFKKVKYVIVGAGEKKEELINGLTVLGCNVDDYGIIYDIDKKVGAFNECHFMMNIMKSSVCVGLTMKSVDYFQMGLPVINNIPYDNKNMITEYKAGFTISDENLDDTIKKICELEIKDFNEMRKHSRQIFEENFSKDVFYKKIREIIKL